MHSLLILNIKNFFLTFNLIETGPILSPKNIVKQHLADQKDKPNHRFTKKRFLNAILLLNHLYFQLNTSGNCSA